MRIAALFSPREEHHAVALGTAVVASPETFEDALREEAEQTDKVLGVAVILPPPQAVPVEEVHADVVPSCTWSVVHDLNATMAIVVAESTEVSS
jgi:hypothetical protein